MKQKYIKWIGIVNGILAIISGGFSIYEKLIKEKELTKGLVALTILFLLLALICFFVLWKISEKEKESLKNNLQKKEVRIRKLEKEMCQECKKIYSYSYPDDEWISFSENPNKVDRERLKEHLWIVSRKVTEQAKKPERLFLI